MTVLYNRRKVRRSKELSEPPAEDHIRVIRNCWISKSHLLRQNMDTASTLFISHKRPYQWPLAYLVFS